MFHGLLASLSVWLRGAWCPAKQECVTCCKQTDCMLSACCSCREWASFGEEQQQQSTALLQYKVGSDRCGEPHGLSCTPGGAASHLWGVLTHGAKHGRQHTRLTHERLRVPPPPAGTQLNLLDTPGHQDFSEDTYRQAAPPTYTHPLLAISLPLSQPAFRK